MTLVASMLDAKYVLLLSVLALLRCVWPRRHYLALVLLGTAVIIGLASPQTLLIISGVTVFFVYPLNRLLRIAADRGWPAWVSASLLPVGISVLVTMLVGFKLCQKFALPWPGGLDMRLEVLALVGFSYFIFRAISVLRINAILKVEERTPWAMLCYTLFPPTITAGPIQKYQDFRQQLLNPAPLTRSLFYTSIYRITRGYFRKMVIGLVLNSVVQKLLVTPSPTLMTSVLTVVILYFYFYYDFAGYSDIAIGFGLLLGIKVPENFRKPFLATSVSEFWRNWHITFADWFREHVYIPLGGMRSSPFRAAALAFSTMLLAGLWHGLSANFIIWGAWHGAWLAFEAISRSGPLPPALRHGPKYWGRVLWTNARVAFPCILFLPDPDSILRLLRGCTKLVGP